MSLELKLSNYLMYFSMIIMFEEAAILLVVIITLLSSKQINSAKTSDLTPFKSLLMLEI